MLLRIYRVIGCENAIGIMTKLQSSLAAEETWVDGTTEKLSALPTATSALELDVCTCPSWFHYKNKTHPPNHHSSLLKSHFHPYKVSSVSLFFVSYRRFLDIS